MTVASDFLIPVSCLRVTSLINKPMEKESCFSKENMNGKIHLYPSIGHISAMICLGTYLFSIINKVNPSCEGNSSVM